MDDIMPLILEVAHKYLIKVCCKVCDVCSNILQPRFILIFFAYR